jgi:perosamine synthetase
LIEYENLTISRESRLKNAMMLMDKNGFGIIFVIGENKKLLGILTDGDVRRVLLKGYKTEVQVEEVMQKNFISANKNVPIEEIHQLLINYEHIPLVDDDGVFVDFASRKKIRSIPLMQPSLRGNELAYLSDCLLTGWISSQGNYIKKFEDMFKSYINANFAIATSSGTTALHLALLSLGIKEGDEIIVPNFTFAAPVNAILYVGAKPVLIDVDSENMTLDITKVEKAINSKTKAILPVHLYGYPVDMRELMKIAKKYNLIVIEDCAEAIGSQRDGLHVGTFGDAAIFSFFANKSITTGEGGMLLLKNESAYLLAKKLKDHGMSSDRRYWHEEVGYNYRMTNMQAAIGCAQMERINEFIEKKIEVANTYESYLKGEDNIFLPVQPKNGINSNWLFTIVLDKSISTKRDIVLKELDYAGIQARRTFYPIHLMPPYKKYKTENYEYPNSIMLADSGICLPSWSDIEHEKIHYVAKTLKKIINKNLESK